MSEVRDAQAVLDFFQIQALSPRGAANLLREHLFRGAPGICCTLALTSWRSAVCIRMIPVL